LGEKKNVAKQSDFSVIPRRPLAISGLTSLTEAGKRQVPAHWNQTQVAYPDDACVHQLFERQAELTPSNIAVVFGGQQLTYAQLNARANQLAHRLAALGVGPEVLVAICMERSLEMVIGLLGILKAGAAYVPLDPAYPKDRLSFMLKDTRAPVLLTEERLVDGLPEHDARVVCVDSGWDAVAHESEANLVCKATPENLAYVIYTSGSTGKPKGTLIPHRGLVNYLAWCTQAYAVEGGEGAPVHSSISFDLTITGLFAPLLVGRKVHLVPEDFGIDALRNVLQQENDFSLVKITPAHLQLLSQQTLPEEAAGRTRAFVIGGENFSAESVAFWQEFAPHTTLFNEYGPTECVVGCCVYRIPKRKHKSGSIPIGRPIANTQIYILDGNLQPVPIGVAGEMHIGGAGVARGYLNQPELTAQKFIANPFSGEPGARLYKTGDLARYQPDGTIEFLGRIDHQVKIRGFRVELGEIEAVLGAHPAVKDVVVAAQEIAPGEKRLVAYVVPEGKLSPQPNDLRAFLKQKLPDYMVPAIFVPLESLPLSPNGKLDRGKLPLPEHFNKVQPGEFAAPRDNLESGLREIWESILATDPIGIRDDFFEMGGDSLSAARMMARVEQRLGKRISLSSLLAAPTIEQLAVTLRAGHTSESFVQVIDIQTSGSKPPLFCIGARLDWRRLWTSMGSDQPTLSVVLQPPVAAQFRTPYSVEDIATHLVTAIRERQPQGPYFVTGFCQNGLYAYEVAQQLISQGQQVGLLILFDTMFPARAQTWSVSKRIDLWAFRTKSRINVLLGLKWKDLSDYVPEKLDEFQYRARRAKWRFLYRFEARSSRVQGHDLERILYLAAITYRPKPFAGSVVQFRSSDWPSFSLNDPLLGWARHMTGAFQTYDVAGQHHEMFDDSRSEMLAGTLQACLRSAQESAT